jgi:hypothetical protein
VLFAPGLPDLAAVRAVCAAVSTPLNFMVGIKGKSFSVGELAAAGVKRISLATSLYRAAMTGFLEAACQVRDTGQFGFLDRCLTTPELNDLMRTRPRCGLSALPGESAGRRRDRKTPDDSLCRPERHSSAQSTIETEQPCNAPLPVKQ